MNVPNVQPVVTFASARPGDPAFRTGYEAVFQQTRYENYDDIVPLMPPSLDFIQSLREQADSIFRRYRPAAAAHAEERRRLELRSRGQYAVRDQDAPGDRERKHNPADSGRDSGVRGRPDDEGLQLFRGRALVVARQGIQLRGVRLGAVRQGLIWTGNADSRGHA